MYANLGCTIFWNNCHFRCYAVHAILWRSFGTSSYLWYLRIQIFGFTQFFLTDQLVPNIPTKACKALYFANWCTWRKSSASINLWRLGNLWKGFMLLESERRRVSCVRCQFLFLFYFLNSSGILIIRTYAIWGNHNIFGYFLVAFMLAIWIPLCATLQVFLDSITCDCYPCGVLNKKFNELLIWSPAFAHSPNSRLFCKNDKWRSLRFLRSFDVFRNRWDQSCWSPTRADYDYTSDWSYFCAYNVPRLNNV
jgi:hypothetical protein